MTISIRTDVFERFRAAIDDVLDSPLPNRRAQAESFLGSLKFAGVRLSEFKKVALDLPAGGGAYKGAEALPSTPELYLQLTQEERSELSCYMSEKIEKLKKDFPEIVRGFEQQFS